LAGEVLAGVLKNIRLWRSKNALRKYNLLYFNERILQISHLMARFQPLNYNDFTRCHVYVKVAFHHLLRHPASIVARMYRHLSALN
jgi:hypothetical protein